MYANFRHVLACLIMLGGGYVLGYWHGGNAGFQTVFDDAVRVGVARRGFVRTNADSTTTFHSGQDGDTYVWVVQRPGKLAQVLNAITGSSAPADLPIEITKR